VLHVTLKDVFQKASSSVSMANKQALKTVLISRQEFIKTVVLKLSKARTVTQLNEMQEHRMMCKMKFFTLQTFTGTDNKQKYLPF